MSFSLSQASFEDLLEDYKILTFLYKDSIQKLDFILKKIQTVKPSKFDSTQSEVKKYITQIKYTYSTYLSNFILKSKNLDEEIERKNYYQEFLRTFQEIIGSLITSFDWQSPSFLHTLFPEAGIQVGRIVGNENDYKRDVHLDALKLENQYLKEYIDCPLPYKLFVKAYATSSGMSAFTTILHFLKSENLLKNKALMGFSTYFQSKIVAKQLYGEKIIEVDERDTKAVINEIMTHHPEVIFIDSLANSKFIPLPDVKSIITFLTREYKDPMTIVLDNTGLSVLFQVLPLIAKHKQKITLLSYESLNKYLQFGMDRVTGGMITAFGNNIGKLLSVRENLGTNITDVSSWTVPSPNRKYLELRMKRLFRNTTYLANSLTEKILDSHNKYFKSVIYPGVGSYFTFEVNEKYDTNKFYKSFQKKVIDIAKKKKVALVGGSSFGLNTTRIYITALNSEYGDPFIRISTGSECMYEIEKIKEVLVEAIT